MARRVTQSTLNASSLDILNVIRANASYEYQSSVPEITKTTDIPKVGEILYGNPTLQNQFLNALVNRIALVQIKSATFNNAYAKFKKGFLEFGETVEEVFVNICKAREFSAEKAEKREFKRSLPDVRTAFHIMNYKVQYPITIQDDDLRMAFLSASGVTDLIAKIINSVTTSAEYDEYLLFKYMLIKAISKGKMYPVSIGDGTDMKEAAVKYRSMSNILKFMSPKYNASGVHTVTPKASQYIFMDAQYNAEYDVNVLASAFNMEKADFMGRLTLIDNWTEFDMDRFEIIMDNSDMIEPITDEELALMKDVKAVLLDDEWFQVYDNEYRFTETYVASGLYRNYFLNVWKTISSSPFSNAVVFVKGAVEAPEELTAKVVDVSKDDKIGTVFTVVLDESTGFSQTEANFVQTLQATKDLVAIQRYGAVLVPHDSKATKVKLEIEVGGNKYESGDITFATVKSNDEVTFTKK